MCDLAHFNFSEIDYNEERVAVFIQEQIDEGNKEGNRRNRGPYLAQLELVKQCHEMEGSTCRQFGTC